VRMLIILTGFALCCGLAIQLGLGISVFGPVMMLLLVLFPIVGVLITIDDDLPVGSNEGTGRPRAAWRYWENWADLAIRGSLSGVGFAIDAGRQAQLSVFLMIVGAFAVFALVLFGGRIYSGRK